MGIAAGIVGDAFVRAVLAALDVSAERGGATGLDRRHDLQLAEAHVAGVGLAPRRSMSAKDVGDLQAGPRHPAVVRRAAGASSGSGPTVWLFDAPCTQALYEAVMGTNPSRFIGPRRPVEQVSFEDAEAFIRKLNALVEGLNLSLP